MSRVITERVEITDEMLKPSKRLIDANALMTWFDNHYDDEEVTVGFVSGLIKEQPTIEERKKGEWIRKKSVIDCATFVGDECSECGYFKSMGHANYCPNCGADMRTER